MKSAVAILSLSLGLGFGCGDDDGDMGQPSTPDGGASTDASATDADDTPTSGRCTVERQGVPVQVVFHDDTGAPLATVTTDDDGLAAYDDCVPSGMVTVVNPVLLGGGGGTFHRLITVQNVAIGDHVVFDPPPPTPPDLGPLTITVQNGDDEASIDPDPTLYIATAGDCHVGHLPLDDDHGGEIELTDLDGCLGNDPTNLSIVSIARSEEGNFRGMARVDTDDLVDPATASGGVWAGYGGPTLAAIENAHADAVSGFLVVSPLIDGVLYARASGGFDPTDETLDMAYWPSQIVDGHRVSLALSMESGVTMNYRVRTSVTPPPNSFDLGELMMEPFSTMVVNVIDPKRPVYKWQGGDERAVLARGEITWVDGEDGGRWIVVASGNPGELKVPVLPDSLADKGPQDTSLASVGALVLADRGIPYSEWLENGLTTSAYEDASLTELQHEDEDASIVTTSFSPDF